MLQSNAAQSALGPQTVGNLAKYSRTETSYTASWGQLLYKIWLLNTSTHRVICTLRVSSTEKRKVSGHNSWTLLCFLSFVPWWWRKGKQTLQRRQKREGSYHKCIRRPGTEPVTEAEWPTKTGPGIGILAHAVMERLALKRVVIRTLVVFSPVIYQVRFWVCMRVSRPWDFGYLRVEYRGEYRSRHPVLYTKGNRIYIEHRII